MKYSLIARDSSGNYLEIINFMNGSSLRELDSFTTKFVNQESLSTYLYQHGLIKNKDVSLFVVEDQKQVPISHEVLYNRDNGYHVCGLLRYRDDTDNLDICKKIGDEFYHKIKTNPDFYQDVLDKNSDFFSEIIENIDKENYPDNYSTLRTIIGVQKKYDSIHNISPEYYGVSDSAKISLVFSTFSNLSIPISSEKDSILDTKSFDGFISVDDKNTLCHGLSSSLEKSLLCYQRSLLKNSNQSKKAWDRYVEIDVRNAAVDLERKKLIKKLNNKRELDNTYHWSNLLLRHQVTSDAISKPLDEVNKKVTHRHEKSHFNPHVRK